VLSQGYSKLRCYISNYLPTDKVGVRGNETADRLMRNGSASGFVGPEPALGVSRQELRNKISCWLGNQHRRKWQNLGSTQQQARELILGPCQGTRVRFLSFNRTQSRVDTGLLTGHNTLCRHLHLMGLMDSPLCRKYGVEEETSAHTLCQREALASIRHVHLGSFFLEPEDINTLGTGDADLRFYRVLQSFGSYVTNARRVTQICVFTRGWIPRTLHLITQYMEPFFE
jgi:hypothetical protein